MDEAILPSSRKIKIIAVSIPCLLVVYVLSIGPMAKMEDAGLIGERADKILQLFYMPLAPLFVIPGAESVFNWYLYDIWKVDPMTTL